MAGLGKISRAVDANDRLTSYQTSSPLRDYELLAYTETEDKNEDEIKAQLLLSKKASERKGEWFRVDEAVAYTLIQDLADLPDLPQSPQQLRIV